MAGSSRNLQIYVHCKCKQFNKVTNNIDYFNALEKIKLGYCVNKSKLILCTDVIMSRQDDISGKQLLFLLKSDGDVDTFNGYWLNFAFLKSLDKSDIFQPLYTLLPILGFSCL